MRLDRFFYVPPRSLGQDSILPSHADSRQSLFVAVRSNKYKQDHVLFW